MEEPLTTRLRNELHLHRGVAMATRWRGGGGDHRRAICLLEKKEKRGRRNKWWKQMQFKDTHVHRIAGGTCTSARRNVHERRLKRALGADAAGAAICSRNINFRRSAFKSEQGRCRPPITANQPAAPTKKRKRKRRENVLFLGLSCFFQTFLRLPASAKENNVFIDPNYLIKDGLKRLKAKIALFCVA